MRLGIIGSGNIGETLAKRAIEAGNEVVLSNSRGVGSLAEKIEVLGKNASAGTVNEAAEQEIIILAVPWSKIPDALVGLPNWNGRILIDATNQLTAQGIVDVEPLSGSEIVASHAPGARIIKAFNTLFAQYMDGETPNGRRVLFYAGDDTDAKETVKQLFTAMKFYPVDVGSLASGGRLMQVGGALSAKHFVQPEEEI
jgi:predicted dinucleotide-binding enzyme